MIIVSVEPERFSYFVCLRAIVVATVQHLNGLRRTTYIPVIRQLGFNQIGKFKNFVQ
jgi:hypothetical protein